MLNKRVSKIITIFVMTCAMVLAGFTQSVPVFASGDIPELTVENAMAIDVTTGTHVYSKNVTAKINPGGLTKLLTALVVADGDISDTYKSQIQSMLFEGDNEAASKLASEVAGSESDFCTKMNEKAKALGCKGSNFASVSGNTEDENNYSTMEDLSIIAKAFLNNEKFKDYVTMTDDEDSKAKIGNLQISTESAKIYTSALVIEKDGSEFVALSVGGVSEADNITDSKDIANYAIENFRTYVVMEKGKAAGRVKIKGGRKSYVKVYAKSNLAVTLPAEGDDSLVKTEISLESNLEAPIEKDQVVGKVEALEAGEVTSSVEVIVKEAVVKGGPWSKIGISDYMMVIIAAIIVVLILLIIITKIKIHKKKKRQAEIRRKRREAEAMRIAMERAEKKRRNWPY